jgi:hypothetical protein
MHPRIPDTEKFVERVDGDKETTEQKTIEGLRNNFRVEVHRGARIVLRIGVLCLGAIVLVRIWHMIGPAYYRWLDEPDISSIDKMLFSSAFGGAALNYLKEMMLPARKEDAKE